MSNGNKMDDLMDMIVADESPSQISDKIKELLFAKSAERIEGAMTIFLIIVRLE